MCTWLSLGFQVNVLEETLVTGVGRDGMFNIVASFAGRFRKFAVEIRLQNFAGDQITVSTSVSNAISDSLRAACGDQWPRAADREEAVSVQLVFHVDRDTAVLYRDMSGAKQGYAQSKDELAAAVLTIAGWNPTVPGFGEANKNMNTDRVLLDPFCGTGTLLIQAALMASNVAPGLLRQHWPFQVCPPHCMYMIPLDLKHS